jgi:hypothetical protein
VSPTTDEGNKAGQEVTANDNAASSLVDVVAAAGASSVAGSTPSKVRMYDSNEINGPGPGPKEPLSGKYHQQQSSPFHTTDSGLHSQLSLAEDPGVKELLTTCARYNLDQGVSGMEGGYPAEILEEIRHAETLQRSAPNSPVKGGGLESVTI